MPMSLPYLTPVMSIGTIMPDLIHALIDRIIEREGGFVNHPNDPGGATNFGITQRVARANGYAGSMEKLPRGTAIEIYYSEYAVKPGFAAVAAISPAVGFELFDTGVNMGVARPALWFQEWLNAFNQGGRLYADIKEDGDIGPRTLAAFTAYRAKRGADADKTMIAGLNADQGTRYKELARMRGANEDFVYGWVRQRVAA